MDLFTIITYWFKSTAKVALVMSIIGLCISTVLGIISTPIALLIL